MNDKARRGTQHDLEPIGPDRIRNVILVGPSSSGKTTLIEALAMRTGAITRVGSIQDGTTISDHDSAEQHRQRSVHLSVVPVVAEGTKINLIDTPGYADFVGEVRAGLRAADCALFVVSAGEGIDHTTKALWAECEHVGMPRAIVISKIDAPRADVDAVLAEAKQAFGPGVVAAEVRHGDELVGLLSSRANAGDEAARSELIEGVIEDAEDEDLLEKYLDGADLDEATLKADLAKAVAKGHFHPVLQVSATDARGLDELLDVMANSFPAPADHPSPEAFTPTGEAADQVTCDPAGPLVAEVIKTTSDHFLGRVSVVRIFSGTLTGDTKVHVSGHFDSFFADDHTSGHADHDDDEKAGGLGLPFGKHQQPTQQIVAGDIGVVSRLAGAETGDTVSAVELPVVLKPWAMPDAMLPVALEAASRSDEDKLSGALVRLTAEDPSLRVEHNSETGQLVLWAMGEAHVEVSLDRLKETHGVEVKAVDVVVPLRETLKGKAAALGRHVKQSGGHGQYGVCEIEAEPLAEGAGFEFVDKIVGGAIPKHYVQSVEKGVLAQMARGCREGFPMVDIKVTLLDGKTHSVDSSEMAFQSAGGLALREVADQVGVTMLEPVDEVVVTVPDELTGTVMSDLSARRGRLLDTGVNEDGLTVIRAHVPQTELLRYAIELRSATHGAGTFTRTFSHREALAD